MQIQFNKEQIVKDKSQSIRLGAKSLILIT